MWNFASCLRESRSDLSESDVDAGSQLQATSVRVLASPNFHDPMPDPPSEVENSSLSDGAIVKVLN